MYYVGVTDTTGPASLASVLHDLSWIIQRGDRVEGLDIEPLPAPEVTVLKHIDRHAGIGVSALADMLAMQPSNVSAAVRTLVERGLVVKSPSPADRRVTQLNVTDRMRRHRTRIEAAWSARITGALERLPDESAAQLVSSAPALILLMNELRERA